MAEVHCNKGHSSLLSSKLFRAHRLLLAPALQLGTRKVMQSQYGDCQGPGDADGEGEKKAGAGMVGLSLMGSEDQGKYQSQLDENLEPEQGSLRIKREQGRERIQVSGVCSSL